MKVKCKYCDTFIEDTEANCPNCGAPVEAAADDTGASAYCLKNCATGIRR